MSVSVSDTNKGRSIKWALIWSASGAGETIPGFFFWLLHKSVGEASKLLQDVRAMSVLCYSFVTCMLSS